MLDVVQFYFLFSEKVVLVHTCQWISCFTLQPWYLLSVETYETSGNSVSSDLKKNYLFIYLFILLFKAAPALYGRSQARGPIRPVAAGLHRSHSNAGSEPRL